jgi:outer membrane protein TolC
VDTVSATPQLRPLALAAMALALAGCVVPLQISGGDRAVAIYREGLHRRGGAFAGARLDGAPPAARRGAPIAAPASLTADEAVALAKAHSARLEAAKAQAAAAAAKIAAAGRLPNPELRVSQLQLDQLLAGQGQVRPSIRVSLPRPGEIEAEVAEARAEEAEARALLHAEEVTLEADVRWAFDDVVLLEAQLAALDAVASARSAAAERLRARLDGATATALEEAMAAMGAVKAEQDRAELAAELTTSKAAFLGLLGLDPAAPVLVVGDALTAWPPPPLPDDRTLVEAALRRRPEVAIAASRIDASAARASLERAKQWPWFSFLELGYQVQPGVPAGLGWTFQAGVEVPILDTNRDGVARTAAKKAFDAEVERVAREVGVGLRAARAAATLVTELRARSLPATERAASAVKRALEGHDVDVVSALTVDERRVVLEMRLLSAMRSYRVAVDALRRAAGGRIP